MLDIQFIRDNSELVQEKSKQKGYSVDVNKLLELDKTRRQLLTQIESERAARNAHAKLLSTPSGPASEESIQKGKQIKENLVKFEEQLKQAETEYDKILRTVPNMPLADVPIGGSEAENRVVKEWGEKPQFDFEVKNHWQIGEARDWIDKTRAAKVAGARFAYLKGGLVLLEFALWQFALHKLTDKAVLQQIISANKLEVSAEPFIPVLPPAVAKTNVYEATGRLNKEDQTYKLADDDLWLNASAEHTMAPMYMGEILNEEVFPIRYIGYTTAFRREAGTYGKDMEGILRLHQFNKLEMESFSLLEHSLQEHYFMIAIQEYLMQQLNMPYRVILKCTADIGGPNARGVDIEAWLPGQNKYRETHTADYITDYQSRRMQTKVRRQNGALQLVHTNDATVFSERPLIAIIENNQTKDGHVHIPKVLQPFLGGREQV